MRPLLSEGQKVSLKDMVMIVFRCSPKCASLMAINTVSTAIIPMLQVLSTAYFIDSVMAMLAGEAGINRLVLPSVFMFMLLIYSHGINPLFNFTKIRMELHVKERMRTSFMAFINRLEYKYFEDDKTLDLIRRVGSDPETSFTKVFNDLMDMASLAIRMISIMAIIVFRIWWVVLVICILLVPFIYISIKAGKAIYQTNIDISKKQRRYQYLGEVLSTREHADERTLFGYAGHVNRMWIDQYEAARKLQVKTEKKWYFRMKAMGMSTAVFCVIVLFLLLASTLQGALTIGLFFALVGTMFDLIQAMSWELTGHIDNISRDNEIAKELTAFLALERMTNAGVKSQAVFDFKSLEFRNVSFRYPNADHYTLKGVSFKVDAGAHYSFVGANGSGKTTIIKLLIGLYKEYEGEILLNGVSLRDYAQDAINAVFSSAFQDFARYSLSLRENIQIGDVHTMDTWLDDDLYGVLAEVGLSVCDMGNGLDTQLGKLDKAGVDLSGGQWQKIAIARAIVNQAPVRLLDEPTAALDPISESNIYANFKKISTGRTTIFITHRLASIKTSSQIFVLDKGRIIESGTHDQLMEAGGQYYNMYEAQKGWYI